jgi:hypothetical protein
MKSDTPRAPRSVGGKAEAKRGPHAETRRVSCLRKWPDGGADGNVCMTIEWLFEKMRPPDLQEEGGRQTCCHGGDGTRVGGHVR